MLSNGLIIQFGVLPRRNARENITFPIPFPHKCIHISVESSATWTAATANNIYNKTNYGFSVFVDRVSGGGDPNGTTWFAIGY